MSTHVTAYWEGLSPTLLFISGESSLINATRQAGAFLWPLAFLMAIGVHAILTDRRSRFTLLLLVGFLTAPLSSAITADIGIRRALVMLPFGVLIATFGVERLLVGSAASSGGPPVWYCCSSCPCHSGRSIVTTWATTGFGPPRGTEGTSATRWRPSSIASGAVGRRST